MNNDGLMGLGNGQDDMRMMGRDMQHAKNPIVGVGDEAPGPLVVVNPSFQTGGPMKEALDAEHFRHKAAKDMRIQDQNY